MIGHYVFSMLGDIDRLNKTSWTWDNCHSFDTHRWEITCYYVSTDTFAKYLRADYDAFVLEDKNNCLSLITLYIKHPKDSKWFKKLTKNMSKKTMIAKITSVL